METGVRLVFYHICSWLALPNVYSNIYTNVTAKNPLVAYLLVPLSGPLGLLVATPSLLAPQPTAALNEPTPHLTLGAWLAAG